MLKPPKLGSTKAVAIYPEISDSKVLEGVRVHMRYVGAQATRAWQYQIQADRQAEVLRLAKLRGQCTRDQAPELYAAEAITPEGMQEAIEMVRRVLTDAVASVDGIDLDGQAPVDVLMALPLSALVRLMYQAINMQSLAPDLGF